MLESLHWPSREPGQTYLIVRTLPTVPQIFKTYTYQFRVMNVRLSKDDLIAVDRLHGAVALPDGSGYLGTLNVFHELHCIVSSSLC